MASIAENGYKNVTVATICEAGGFSRGLIAHYFPGKDALLLHAVRQVASDFEAATRAAAAAAGRNPVDRLHAIVAATFREPIFSPERVLVWVALASTSHWSPDLAEIYQNLQRPYRKGLAQPVPESGRFERVGSQPRTGRADAEPTGRRSMVGLGRRSQKRVGQRGGGGVS